MAKAQSNSHKFCGSLCGSCAVFGTCFVLCWLWLHGLHFFIFYKLKNALQATANCTQSFVACRKLQTTACRHACFIFAQPIKKIPPKTTEKTTPKNHRQNPTHSALKRFAQANKKEKRKNKPKHKQEARFSA